MAENCKFLLPRSHLTPSLGVNPFEFLDEFFIPKTRVLGEDFVILACVVFTQCQRVTDRQTDRQTDIPTMASTGLAYQAMLTPCKIHMAEGIRQQELCLSIKTKAEAYITEERGMVGNIRL